MNGLLISGFWAMLPVAAFAAPGARPEPPCQSLAKAEADFAKFIAPDKASFTWVTPGQFHFLQGIAALSPETPPGLPHATRAVLAKGDRSGQGVVMFVLGDNMCLPMAAPTQLIALMEKVLTERLDDLGDEM